MDYADAAVPVENDESVPTGDTTVVDNTITAKCKLREKNEEGKWVETGEEVEITCDYDFGADLNEAIELFGAEVVFNQFKQQATIGAQAFIRRHASMGKDEEAIQEALSEWRPGVRAQKKTPADKVKDLLDGKSPEEIAAILQSIGFDVTAD